MKQATAFIKIISEQKNETKILVTVISGILIFVLILAAIVAYKKKQNKVVPVLNKLNSLSCQFNPLTVSTIAVQLDPPTYEDAVHSK